FRSPVSSLTSRIIACSSVSPSSTAPPGRDQLPPLLLTIKTFPCSQIRPYATSTLIMVSPPHYIELNYYYLTYKIHFHPISIRNPNIHITYKKPVRSHVQLNFLYFYTKLLQILELTLIIESLMNRARRHYNSKNQATKPTAKK